MRKLFIILNSLCILLLGWSSHFDSFKGSSNAFVKNTATFLYPHKTWIVLICSLFVFLYTVCPKFFRPYREKKKFLNDILLRMNHQLFEGEDVNCHRITLFKEINWFQAVARNYWHLVYHLISYRQKWRLYLKMPKCGQYLKVFSRCGLEFQKSSTMFHVERNSAANCQGVTELICFSKAAVLLTDLPDISEIDLNSANSVDDLGSTNKRRVKKYMNKAKIRDFLLLKKIHRRARHFYGTIIEDKGHVWGVLLVDSMGETSPFDERAREIINSFALIISRSVQMEA